MMNMKTSLFGQNKLESNAEHSKGKESIEAIVTTKKRDELKYLELWYDGGKEKGENNGIFWK